MSPTSLDGDMMLLLLYDQKLVFREVPPPCRSADWNYLLSAIQHIIYHIFFV